MVTFDFNKDYILENDTTRLSPLGLDHITDLQSISEESSIWTYFLENGQGIENLTPYIHTAVENRKQGREYPFVVYDKRSNTYAGLTRLYEWNEDLRTVKLGHTWYGKDFQGTGLNKHCKYLLFEFAFEQLEAFRIGFGVHGENVRSLRALASVGCKKEGVLRDFLWKVDGQDRTDLILLSILKKEWQETIKEELALKIKY
ncbi:MAG: GNAT family N-acetyltransferase [Cyanothece sp. SIO1E1]|nr:GNAT family N-acetyltransferase [Cyanothece sp. SIO1E1]